MTAHEFHFLSAYTFAEALNGCSINYYVYGLPFKYVGLSLAVTGLSNQVRVKDEHKKVYSVKYHNCAFGRVNRY